MSGDALKHCRYCSSCGSGEISWSRSPQIQCFSSIPRTVVVLRAKERSSADISGVMTANRSSGPRKRSSASASEVRTFREPAASTW
jgi:hypothetical protein